MDLETYNYIEGCKLVVKRKDILVNGEIVFPGASGSICLGKILSEEGGEGKVYELQNINSSDLDEDLSDIFVAKIYHDHFTAKSKKNKILKMLAMLDNFVDDEALNNVCWPYYAIYDGNEFIGFIMPKASGKTLANLFYPDILDYFPNYTRKELIKICLNIIKKINQLHKHNIIIGDINEDNFIINSPEEVYFIDTDSYQLEDFLCKVERLEYKAPELIEDDDSPLTLITEGYSTAVLIFKILMLGKHPFSCKNVDEYSIEDRILKGLFPYSMDNKITNELVPIGFYKFIWSDFTKELKLFFINIFTRADSLESVNDITIQLNKYLNEIETNSKDGLIPKDFNEYLVEIKKIVEEKKNKKLEKQKIEKGKLNKKSDSNNENKQELIEKCQKAVIEIFNKHDMFTINLVTISKEMCTEIINSMKSILPKGFIVKKENNGNCSIEASDLNIRINCSSENRDNYLATFRNFIISLFALKK